MDILLLMSSRIKRSMCISSSRATWKRQKDPIKALTSRGKLEGPTQHHRPKGLQRATTPTVEGRELHSLHPLTQSPALSPFPQPASTTSAQTPVPGSSHGLHPLASASVYSYTAVCGWAGSQRREPDKWERGRTPMQCSGMGTFYMFPERFDY